MLYLPIVVKFTLKLVIRIEPLLLFVFVSELSHGLGGDHFECLCEWFMDEFAKVIDLD